MNNLSTADVMAHVRPHPSHVSIISNDSTDLATAGLREHLAHLSHEMKTPLNAILGFSEILKEDLTDPALRHYANVIRSCGETLLSIVNKNLEIDQDDPGGNLTADDAAESTAFKNAREEWEELFINGTTVSPNPLIYAVDDNEDNLGLITHLFAKEKINVYPFRSGSEVLDAVQTIIPNLILLDVIMPCMDGYEVCRRLKETDRTKDIPIIFLTGKTELESIVEGFESGGVDYIGKPFKKDELLTRVRTHLKLASMERSLKEALVEKDQLLNETLKGSIKVLIDILAMTKPEAFAQTLRVRNIAKKMAIRLGLTNAWEVEIGVLLSHLGCAVIPNEIVAKKHTGEKLSNQESTVFFSHPKAAARIISNIPRLEQVAESIQNQYADYSPNDNPDLIRDFIRIVFDYDNLVQSGYTQQQALEMMNVRMERYNPRVVGALEAEVRRLMDGYVVRTVPFEELKPGMVLADDIRNASNLILVRRNSEVSDVMLEKLRNLRYCGRTYEPVKILEQNAL